jgi:hypothetical protein
VSVAPRCSAPPDEHRNRAKVSLAGSLRRPPKRRTSSLRQAASDLVVRVAMESSQAAPSVSSALKRTSSVFVFSSLYGMH